MWVFPDSATLYVSGGNRNMIYAIFDVLAKTAGIEIAHGTDQLIGRVPTD